MAKKQKQIPQEIGPWYMVRDVLIASINKGQFLLGICGISLIIILLRLPEEGLSKLIVGLFNGNSYICLIIIALLIIGWFFHIKSQNRISKAEIERVAKVRNQLQSENLGNKIESSREEE